MSLAAIRRRPLWEDYMELSFSILNSLSLGLTFSGTAMLMRVPLRARSTGPWSPCTTSGVT